MKGEEIKKYIKENKEKLPLSYHHELNYKKIPDNETKKKIVVSEKYNDKDYSILPFYKRITRF